MENYYDQNLEYDNEASASSKPINLELFFPSRVASPVYTGRPIKGEDGGSSGNESIKCMLIDSQTRQQVTDCRVTALNVKLVLIGGDFHGISSTIGEEGTWTSMDFKRNIVGNWENKRNLLLGDVSLLVKNGSGTVGDIRIKHDSKPLKNTKFRLGAMVDHDYCCCYRIKEAITNVFEVKDQRNEPKFSRQLSPNDCVWRLINIRKHGPIHKRLERKNIWTVMDFLNMHYSNPQALDKIHGIKGKKLDETLAHAKTSLSNNVSNAYGRNGFTSQQSNIEPPCFDYSGSMIKRDKNCYKPQPAASENDVNNSNNMIVDHTFSIRDVEICDHACLLAFEPYPDNEIMMNGAASSNDGHGRESGKGYMAKKRWKKLRATIWFWMVGFTKKLRSCVGAP